MTQHPEPNTTVDRQMVDHHAATLRTALGLVPPDMIKSIVRDFLRSHPELLEAFLQQAASAITSVIIAELRTLILSAGEPTTAGS